MSNTIKILTAALIVFMVFSVFAICLSFSMTGHLPLPCDGNINGVCDMSLLNHLGHIQHFSDVIPSTFGLFFLLVIFVYFTIVSLFTKSILQSENFHSLKQQETRISLFDPLQYSFARGILHSKAF